MKKLLFILMLISIVSNCLAQVVSTTDLCNTEWVLRSPNCDGCKKFIAFTLSHKTDKVFFVEKQKTYYNLLAELKNRLKISIFLWRKSCASR